MLWIEMIFSIEKIIFPSTTLFKFSKNILNKHLRKKKNGNASISKNKKEREKKKERLYTNYKLRSCLACGLVYPREEAAAGPLCRGFRVHHCPTHFLSAAVAHSMYAITGYGRLRKQLWQGFYFYCMS